MRTTFSPTGKQKRAGHFLLGRVGGSIRRWRKVADCCCFIVLRRAQPGDNVFILMDSTDVLAGPPVLVFDLVEKICCAFTVSVCVCECVYREVEMVHSLNGSIFTRPNSVGRFYVLKRINKISSHKNGTSPTAWPSLQSAVFCSGV